MNESNPDNKQINTGISKKNLDILKQLSKDGNHDSIINEALNDYFEKKGLNKKTEEQNDVKEEHFLVMLPVYKDLWDFSDKGELVVGKRKIREIYGFKTFLNFTNNDLKEYDRLQKKIKDLNVRNKLGTISNTQKDHIDISFPELKKCDSQGNTFTLIKGNDGVYGVIRCSEIMHILKDEFYYKDKDVKFYIGKYIAVLDSMEELEELLRLYNTLTFKLEKLAVMIYEGYKPIHLKWEKIRIEKEKGIRATHKRIQVIVASLIFTGITLCYLFAPTVFYFPMPNEIVSWYRYFLGAYLLSFPVFILAINYIGIYAVWFNGRLSMIKKNVRDIVDKDIKVLREKIGYDVFR